MSSSYLTKLEPNGFTCFEPWAQIKRPIFWKLTRIGMSKMNFFDCISDVVCIWYNDNFLIMGCKKIKSKQLSEFGSRTRTTSES